MFTLGGDRFEGIDVHTCYWWDGRGVLSIVLHSPCMPISPKTAAKERPKRENIHSNFRIFFTKKINDLENKAQ